MGIIYASASFPLGKPNTIRKRTFARASRTASTLTQIIDPSAAQVRVSTVYPNTGGIYAITVGPFQMSARAVSGQPAPGANYVSLASVEFATEAVLETIVRRDGSRWSLIVDHEVIIDGYESTANWNLIVNSSNISEIIVSDDLGDNLIGSFVADVAWTETGRTGDWEGGVATLQTTSASNAVITGNPGGAIEFQGTALSGTPELIAGGKVYAAFTATGVTNGAMTASLQGGAPVAIPQTQVTEIASVTTPVTLKLAVP